MHFLIVGLLLCYHVFSATYTWTGEAGDENWANPNNWTPNDGVPSSVDTAIFAQLGTTNFPSESGTPAASDPVVGSVVFNGAIPSISIGPFDSISPNIFTIQSSVISHSGSNQILGDLVNAESITTNAGILSFNSGEVQFPSATTISGSGITELAKESTWPLPSQSLNISSSHLRVSSLTALGESMGGLTPPSGLSMTNSTLQIGINNFTISAIPITLNASETVDTNGLNATIASAIGGAGSLIKTGNGTLFLTNVTNNYSGSTTIAAGTLNLTSNGNVGGSSSLIIHGSANLQAGASFTLARPVQLSGGNANIDSNGNTLTISGQISGSGNLNKVGAGILILSGANNYSGATLVSAGTLQAGSSPNAFGNNSAVSVLSSATLSLGFFSNTIGSLSGVTGGTFDLGTATLTVNNGNNQTFSGLMTGAGSLTLNSGTFFLRGMTNNYSGTTTIAGGILNVVSDANLGTSTLVINNGGTLQAGTTFTLARDVTLSGGFGNIDTNGNNLTMSGLILGAGGLNKIGEGTFFLTLPNTYLGGTIITEGTINIINNTNLSSGSVTINNGATLQAGAEGINFANALSLNGTAKIDTNAHTFTLSGTIGGSGLLNKIGEGTLVLTAGNNYSGGTTVNAGTLMISSDSNLGTGSLTMLGGITLSAAGPFSLNSGRPVFLGSGIVTIDSNGNNISINGPISGAGLLLKADVGTLTLTGANSYLGGTLIQGGTLNIASDANLGVTNGALTIDGGTTLQSGGNFFLSPERTVNLSGGIATIDTVAFNPTIAGPIVGPGSLNKIGAGTLTLLGANTYTGGTQVSEGNLQGNTTGLQGNIDISSGGALAFNQVTSGTYSGTLSGSGSLLFLGGGTVTVAGSSPSFSGPTTVSDQSTLVITGSLSSSPTTVESGSSLTGTGTIGPLTVGGRVIPGIEGTGTLTVNGDLSFTPPGTLLTIITPTGNGLLAVNGTANLASGTSEIDLGPGFFGFSGSRTILTAGLVNGTFANLILDPRLEGFLIYNPNSVQLFFQVLNPFFEFPFANANERAVGNNLDALIRADQASSDLLAMIDALQGLSVDEINNALNQLHPAALSAYAELQVELGGQLLSMFHRRPMFTCGCYDSFRLWVEPFGNWLHEKNQGMQIGFHATTRGIAAGTDYQFLESWTIGIGGAYSLTDMRWSQYRSYGYVESGYLAFYNDFLVGNFFLGFSGYAGKDHFDNIRKIRFSTIDQQAKSHLHGFEMGAQLTSAYYFGTRSFQLYPYATADFLYLKNSSFSESGADSLDLEVNSYRSSNLRAEAGGAFSFVDRNIYETICIAPMFSMGYVLELPLHRDHFHARFAGTSIPFTTTGWNMAWQLLNLKMGLDITYRCFTLRSSYGADISPEGDSPFFNQRANFNMSFSF